MLSSFQEEKHMARPKSIFLSDLAERAHIDLEMLDEHKIILKLRAIAAAAKFPVASVAEIFGVAAETIWRWAKAYQKLGVSGLYPKPRTPKPSKLAFSQKAEVLAWIDERKTADGQPVHWTLERLRQAISDKFGVTLGLNTIWVWLRRENRKLKVPRPRHAKGDKEAQEAFKKTS
jgi:transposase